jgi:4-hydroxybenzoate polyprenyltransferase
MGDNAVAARENMKKYLLMYSRALRVHQHVKNLLVFVPVVTAQRFTDPAVLLQASIAFLAFSLCTSSGYLLNDYLDLRNDRLHPTKKTRPLASGELPLLHMLVLVPLLFLLALATAMLLPGAFLATLLLYYCLTFCYSLWLKRLMVLDVMILAFLYSARIVAGLAATTIAFSFWLLAFSFFLFLSLAFVKRYTELAWARDERHGAIVQGRGYEVGDIPLVASLGGASGYLAVLVLAFYLNSQDVMKLYRDPKVLWLLCPIMLYWISRVWFITQRGEMTDDPVVFALEDKVSLFMGLLVAGIILAAR